MRDRVWPSMLAAAICVGLAALSAWARPGEPAPATGPTTAPALVELNFPENLDLKVLIDYVGKRQGINFIYDEQVGNKKLTIKSPQKVPADSLLTLLESALTMKGLAMTPSETPGMMRIEVAKGLTVTAAGPWATSEPADDARPPLAMTRVFELRHAGAQQVDTVIKPFLAAPTANVVALPEHEIVIITDYTANMKRLGDLIAVLDRPRREVDIRFVPVRHVEAMPLSQKAIQLLAGKVRARSGAAKDAAADVLLVADERTNQLAVVGGAEPVAEALAIIESLDVPLGLETRTYKMLSASPERVDRLVKELIGEATAKRLYKAAADRDANLLIVTTTADIHQQIGTVVQTLDKPVEDAQSPVRFYKLENAKAADVLTTLQSIEGEGGLGDVSIDGVAADRKDVPERERTIAGPTEEQVNAPVSKGRVSPGAPSRTRGMLDLRSSRVMADEASNMIIVVAKPSMHPVYEKLIKRLDVRRPQVHVEATVVAIDTTDDFSLGVEISRRQEVNGGEGKLITFNSFGLSDVNKTDGSLTLKPGVGFNGALLSSDIADIVVKALASDSRAKVVSRPSVLINDNAEGNLVSENEEPFSSVNASSTVATTSFAGYSSAGTSIKITPQISEGEHLKLEYEITLSSFGETRSESLPPSRQRNTLSSEVTIPNGYTIVVGGLTRETFSESVDRVPGLGHIPLLEYMFSSRTTQKRKTTLFVFIRAAILRDDKFKDLKVLSRQAAGESGLPCDWPVSEPLEIR